MAKCINCQKWGLFLKTDAAGLCSACALEAAKKAEAEEIARLKQEERIRAINEARAKRKAYIASQQAIFREHLNSLPHFQITTEGSKRPIQRVGDIAGLTYSNITARTNPAKLGSFVVIDTETTGLSAHRDSILEVAAIKYLDFKPIEVFHTLINPPKPIPPDSIEIHGITDSMVANAPKIYEIMPSLQSFIGSHNLVGHNLPFDLKFLYRAGLDLSDERRKYYDTLQIAQRMLTRANYEASNNYDVIDHKLETLCEFFNIIRLDAHRALGDAYDTARLLEALFNDKTT